MKYRKKPVVIDAEQYTYDNQLVEGICKKAHNGYQGNAHIHTLEGILDVRFGDWIAKGVKDEYYPIKPDIFEMTYELLPTPKPKKVEK